MLNLYICRRMRRSLFFFTFLALSIHLSAQEKPKKEYLTFDYQLVVDNDVFTLDLTMDQYYSSGIYPEVRMLLDSNKKAKKIRSYKLNHRIYTPYWIGHSRLEQIDRPYAGIISGSITNEYYFHTNKYLRAELELGWLGPGVRMGQQQSTWHRWFGMPQPMGWQYQIEDTPVVNLYLNYIQPLYSSYRFEVSSQSNLSMGTVYNNFRQSLVIRTGELRPIHQSSYVASSLGRKRKERQQKTEEFYFFYSPGVEYVLYNATLQGGLIGPESPDTVDAIPWVIQHRFGVMFSWPRFDLSFTRFWRSKENDSAMKHTYVAIRLNQRF